MSHKVVGKYEQTTFAELAIGDYFTFPGGIDHHRKIADDEAIYERTEDHRRWKPQINSPVTKIGHTSTDTE